MKILTHCKLQVTLKLCIQLVTLRFKVTYLQLQVPNTIELRYFDTNNFADLLKYVFYYNKDTIKKNQSTGQDIF